MPIESLPHTQWNPCPTPTGFLPHRRRGGEAGGWEGGPCWGGGGAEGLVGGPRDPFWTKIRSRIPRGRAKPICFVTPGSIFRKFYILEQEQLLQIDFGHFLKKSLQNFHAFSRKCSEVLQNKGVLRGSKNLSGGPRDPFLDQNPIKKSRDRGNPLCFARPGSIS